MIAVRFNHEELQQLEAATDVWRTKVEIDDDCRAAWIRWAALSKAKEALEDAKEPPEPASQERTP